MKTQTTFLLVLSSLILSGSVLFKEFILVEKSQDKLPKSTAIHSEIKANSNLEIETAINESFSSNNSPSNRMAPTVLCQSITVQLGPSGSITIAENAVDNGSTGNGVLSFDTDITTFDCDDIGSPVNVTLTVTDDDGSTDCTTAIVTVEDSIAPTLTGTAYAGTTGTNACSADAATAAPATATPAVAVAVAVASYSCCCCL